VQNHHLLPWIAQRTWSWRVWPLGSPALRSSRGSARLGTGRGDQEEFEDVLTTGEGERGRPESEVNRGGRQSGWQLGYRAAAAVGRRRRRRGCAGRGLGHAGALLGCSAGCPGRALQGDRRRRHWRLRPLAEGRAQMGSRRADGWAGGSGRAGAAVWA
jgi:hypothetical protein